MSPPDLPEQGCAAPSEPLVVRTDRLPADLSSSGRARQLVRQALREADRSQWLEACELATSEVVSNAVLHAHTDSELTVAVHREHVRVEVRDFSPVLPVQRDYTEQATTGRGLSLVAALTEDHGLTDIGPGGKTVWFTVVGELSAQSEADLIDAWAGADWDLGELLDGPVAGGPRTTTVCLRALPATLWLAARQHHDALVRELVLYLAEHDDVDVDVPATDRARATISTAVVAAVEGDRREQAAGRSSDGDDRLLLAALPVPIDVQVEVADHLAQAFAAMQDTLDAAERLARTGLLLARPGLPEIVAVRDWACEQVTAQLAGVAPTPWPGVDLEHFTTAVHERAGGPEQTDWDVAAVRDSARGAVAADEANRIIAVSRPLADLLGWEVDELVGRRVVSLVPPELREAHVAGFTRHLTTGEVHILDVPLTVPVLHRDGRALPCHLLVQQAPTSTGRAVYLAWISLAEGG